MTPRERLLTTLRGGKADRVPLVLEGAGRVSRSRVDAIEDAPWREICQRVYDQTHCVRSCNTGVNRYLVTPSRFMREVSRIERNGEVEVTTEIETPKGPLTAVTGHHIGVQTTWTKKYPVESLADVDKIRSIPWEISDGVGPPDLSDLPDDFDKRGIIHAGISSPFVCVAGMMPYDDFLELCATEFELIKELTAQCLGRILDLLDVVLAPRTVEYVWLGGSEWLTPPMASPRLYDELVQQFETPVIDRVHAAGALVHVHCHGNVRSTLERVIERGGDFLEPMEPPPDGDVTMAEAKAIAAGRITLGGSVEARVLENEGPASAEAAARAAFEGGKERMVFQTTAGPLSSITPRTHENYHRIIDVWEALSPLDQAP